MTSNQLPLFLSITKHQISSRYRGSLLGVVWALLTPLFLLTVFTVVFGGLLQTRWSGPVTTTSTGEFVVVLFTGLVVFNFFADVVSAAPTLILSNANFVTKIVFPLEILAPAAVGAGIFQFIANLLILFAFTLAVFGQIPATALWLPVILAPFFLLVLGIAWFLAACGVFIRDINHILGPVLTAHLFLSPVFFPLSALPDWIVPWIAINPISFPVQQCRTVLLWGGHPDFWGLCVYAAVAFAVAMTGYLWFQRTRKGFADVL